MKRSTNKSSVLLFSFSGGKTCFMVGVPSGVLFALAGALVASRLAPQGIAAAELGSHSPLGDRQARLSGAERANHGAKRSYPSARHNFPQTPCNLHNFMLY